MSFKLTAHPPWRQLLLIAVALPLAIVAAVLAFAWPAARIAPRDLPLGVVGATASTQTAVTALQRTEPGAFDLTLYVDEPAARRAIENRHVYGALVVSSKGIRVLTASAASPTVAQLLTQVGQRLAAKRAPNGRPLPVTSSDVVATAAADPHGQVLSSALLPLTICGVILASVIALVLKFTPAWRQLVALVVVAATAGLGAYLIAQTFLGVLPHQHVATWASLALTILAISASTAGLIALIGPAGLGVSAILMVFIGNPFSGSTSATELLPKGVGDIGQWLPPGAGVSLLRGTAYFDGNGTAAHIAVLALWAGFGMLAVVLGHRSFTGFAAKRSRVAARQSPTQIADTAPSFNHHAAPDHAVGVHQGG